MQFKRSAAAVNVKSLDNICGYILFSDYQAQA